MSTNNNDANNSGPDAIDAGCQKDDYATTMWSAQNPPSLSSGSRSLSRDDDDKGQFLEEASSIGELHKNKFYDPNPIVEDIEINYEDEYDDMY